MTADQATVGVAIAIPEPHATVLTGWRRRVGDSQADLIWPHVTLLPPTPIARGDLPKIEQHLSEAASFAMPFVMHLLGTGTFRPTSPVVFIQVARGVANCEQLERVVRSGPLLRELDFPYHPHVTIAHDVPDHALDLAYDGLADFVARFVVEACTLFERSEDGEWHRRRDFPLGLP